MHTTELKHRSAVPGKSPLQPRSESRPLWLRLVSTILTTVIGAAVLAAVAVPVVPRLLGWDIMIISTPSMEPTYPVGTLTFVEPATARDIEVGTPMVFRSPNSPMDTVTHRVVKFVDVEGKRHFRTQGDGNDAPDASLVPPRDVVGVVAHDIPRLGWAVDRLQRDTRLLMALVAVPAGLIILGELRTLVRTFRSKDDAEPEEMTP